MLTTLEKCVAADDVILLRRRLTMIDKQWTHIQVMVCINVDINISLQLISLCKELREQESIKLFQKSKDN